MQHTIGSENKARENALIFYFSATGNTWLAAKAIARRLSERGVQTDIAAIDEMSAMPDMGRYSVIGVGYPIFVFSIPGYVQRFIRKLPQGEGRKAFAFATMGGGTFGSEALASLLLRNKGYRVIAARPFVAANNDRALTGADDPDAPVTREALERMAADVESWTDDMLREKSGIVHDTTGWKLAAAVTGFAFTKLIPFHVTTMPFWFLKADSSCTGCGYCERICPVGNIKGALGRPRFGTRCIFCERCTNYCPKNAIHFLFSRRRPRYNAPGFRPPLLRKAGT